MSGCIPTVALSSMDDPGEGRESLDSFEADSTASLFSWELQGSTASLLGTGVSVVGRFCKDRELDFVVVSFKQEDRDGLLSLEVGVEALLPVWAADLEKNPRMLCCFPVDESVELLLFLAMEGVFAGVRAGALGFSPIFAVAASIGQQDTQLQDRNQTPTGNSRHKDTARWWGAGGRSKGGRKGTEAGTMLSCCGVGKVEITRSLAPEGAFSVASRTRIWGACPKEWPKLLPCQPRAFNSMP